MMLTDSYRILIGSNLALFVACCTSSPSKTPTGSLAFVEFDGKQTDIVAYDFETGTLNKVTDTPYNESFPALAAHGSAFTRMNPDNFNYEIYIKTDTNNSETRVSEIGVYAFYPAWSWDEKNLSYQTGRGIYLLAADGTDLHALSADGNSARAVWRPHSRSLAFTKGQAITGFDIFLVDLTTGNQHSLVATEAQEFALDWSPDGQQLLYSSAPRDTEEDRIFVLDLRTGSSRPFFADERMTFYYQTSDATWSPDGNWIAVEIEKQICIYDLNGILWDCIGEGGEPDWGQ